MKRYPQEIYVTREGEGQDECLIAHETAEGPACANEDVPCAIYRLVSTGKVVAASTYVENPRQSRRKR
jgi:hypothetical protein